MKRALVLGLALLAALIAYPTPSRTALPRARVLDLWSIAGERSGPGGLAQWPNGAAFDAHGAPPRVARRAGADLARDLADRAMRRVSAALGPGSQGLAEGEAALGLVRQRARANDEDWLVTWVIVDAAGEGSVKALAFGPGVDDALDDGALRGRIDGEALEAWFAAHLASPERPARERWPTWVAPPPRLGAELVLNGGLEWPASERAAPNGWRVVQGRVVRRVDAEGRAYLAAADEAGVRLRQRVPLPRATGELELRLRSTWPPDSGAVVTAVFPVDLAQSGTTGALEDSTGRRGALQVGGDLRERTARLPAGLGAVELEVALPPASRAHDSPQRALAVGGSGVSVRATLRDG